MTERPMRKLKRMRSMRVLLMPTYFERLVWAARARGINVETLVHDLIERIARDDLINAVLDDGYSAEDDFAKSIDLAYETDSSAQGRGRQGLGAAMTLSYLVGRRNGHTTPWNEAMVARLKELWAQGYSATEIANQLDGISRCGVITKAHRLNLAARKPGRRGKMKRRPTP